MLELLEQLFRQVRAYFHSEQFNRDAIYAQSSNHLTMQFDHDAEEILVKGLQDSGLGFEIMTEERPSSTTTLSPTYRIVVDPIDGSNNVVRGIAAASVALAMLPIEAPIIPENVQWALVGELFSGTVYEAQRGGGAFCNRKRCQVSDIKSLSESIAGVNFDGRSSIVLSSLLTEEPRVGKVRRSGSSALDSVYVASGAYDAYIDVGDQLTAESFLASASIVLEAGGIVTDSTGKPLRPITNLTEPYSLAMAGTKALHKAIIQRLNVS